MLTEKLLEKGLDITCKVTDPVSAECMFIFDCPEGNVKFFECNEVEEFLVKIILLS